MSVKKVAFAGILVLGVGGLGVWMTSNLMDRQPSVCRMCARPIHAGQDCVLYFNNGSREHTCCPRCGFHFFLANSPRVQAVMATDHVTGDRIAANQSVFVEGSQVMTCCTTPAVKRELEQALDLVWDRCLPSLIAFKEESDAREFQRRFGGRVLSYSQALESVDQK